MESENSKSEDDAAIALVIPALCAHFPAFDKEKLENMWVLTKTPPPQFEKAAKVFLNKCLLKRRREFLERYKRVTQSTKDPLRILIFLLSVKATYVDSKQEESLDSVFESVSTPPSLSESLANNPVLQVAFVVFNKRELLSPLPIPAPIATSTPAAKAVHFNFERTTYHSPVSMSSSGTGTSDLTDGYKPMESVDVVMQILDAWNGHTGDMFRYCTRGYTVEPTQLTKRALFEYQPNIKIQLKEILLLAGLAKQLAERVRGEFGTDVMARTFYFSIDEFCLAPFRKCVGDLYEAFRDDPRSVRMIHLKFFAARWGPRLQVVVNWVNKAEEHLISGPRERRCGMQLLTEVISQVLCTSPLSWHHSRAAEISGRMYNCFHDLVKSWLLNGELNEFNEEFMIYCDCSVPDDQAWNRRFRIYEAFVPGLLKLYPLLTEKILSIGKAMWFLKESNNQHLYSENWEEHCKLVARIEPHFYYSSEHLHVLAEILDRLEEMGNSVLLRDLMEKYHFAEHIRALRSHFMLTDVDFAARLYDEMRHVIMKPSFGLHDAARALRNAVDRSGSWSSFPFERCLLLSTKDTLAAKFSDVTLADMKLNFLYSPASDFPIIRIILWNSLERYNFIFRFLWNIFATRQTSINLAIDHVRLCNDLRRMKVASELQDDHERLSALSRTFSFGFYIFNLFTSRLSFYVNQVVSQRSSDFTESLREATSLDGVIKLHRVYISGIYRDLCLDGSQLYPVLNSVIRCISKFSDTYSAFKKQYGEDREMFHGAGDMRDDTQVFESEEGVLFISEEANESLRRFKELVQELGKMNHGCQEAQNELIRLLVKGAQVRNGKLYSPRAEHVRSSQLELREQDYSTPAERASAEHEMYASKRRQRNFKRVREPAKPGAATNPSKRHRERLNGELETVAALLPYDHTVISRLDKLSVLRLAVSFLQVKAHFQACLHEYSAMLASYGTHSPFLPSTIPIPSIVDPHSRDQLLIDPQEPGFDAMASRALGGFILILNPNGEIYYVSENIELYLGFHQSDILHQSLYDMIHSEDRDDIRQQLQYDFKGHKDFEHAFEKNVCARFRCLLDNTCGFVRVDIRGKIIPLYGIPPPYSTEPSETPTTWGFAAICSPFVPPLYIDHPVEDPILKTKHALDFSLISMDHRVRTILEIEEGKTPASFYDFVHPEDAICVAEAHKEVAKNSASGLLIYRLISAVRRLVYYFQSSCRMFFKNGKPEAIGLTHRMLTEVEGTILLEKRSNLKAKLLSFDDSLLQSPQNLQSTAALPSQIAPRAVDHGVEAPLPAALPLEPKKVPKEVVPDCLPQLLYNASAVPQYPTTIYPVTEPTNLGLEHYDPGVQRHNEDLVAFAAAAAVPSYPFLPLTQDMQNLAHLGLDARTHASLKAYGYPTPDIVYPAAYPGTSPVDYGNPYPTSVHTTDGTGIHQDYFYPPTSTLLAPRATHALPDGAYSADESAFVDPSGYKMLWASGTSVEHGQILAAPVATSGAGFTFISEVANTLMS